MFKKIRTLAAIYFVFLIFDFTSSDELFPHFVYEIMGFYTNFWNWVVPFTGEHLLQLSYPITVKPNGSGDTSYNYVLQLLWVVFALMITLIWTFLDRKRPSYSQFQYWSRIVIRYFLAYMLFVYGFVKVIKLQFPFPNLYRLTETYGDSTPMGLAWTFIGYSTGYNIFIGGAEVLAGLLLFFKRTALFGSLVAMTVMANVFAMNMAYDIPVKIFSFNLLLMAVWIAWYDKDRLINFFFLNKETYAAKIAYPFHTKWKKIVQYAMKALVIGFAFYATLYANFINAEQYGDLAPKPALYGIYDVETFEKDGQLLPPLTTDSTRWKRMIINSSTYARLTLMNDSIQWMKLAVDTTSRTIKFTSEKDSTSYDVSYIKTPNTLELKSTTTKNALQVHLKMLDLSKFPLVNTGFHWINEYPNNR